MSFPQSHLIDYCDADFIFAKNQLSCEEYCCFLKYLAGFFTLVMISSLFIVSAKLFGTFIYWTFVLQIVIVLHLSPHEICYLYNRYGAAFFLFYMGSYMMSKTSSTEPHF